MSSQNESMLQKFEWERAFPHVPILLTRALILLDHSLLSSLE